jgi:hypothetical protein
MGVAAAAAAIAVMLAAGRVVVTSELIAAGPGKACHPSLPAAPQMEAQIEMSALGGLQLFCTVAVQPGQAA